MKARHDSTSPQSPACYSLCEVGTVTAVLVILDKFICICSFQFATDIFCSKLTKQVLRSLYN